MTLILGKRYIFISKRYKKREKFLTNDVSLSILYKWLAKAGYGTGDWSNGMIGVSKTFGGSSILSSPAIEKPWKQRKIAAFKAFFIKTTREKRGHSTNIEV